MFLEERGAGSRLPRQQPRVLGGLSSSVGAKEQPMPGTGQSGLGLFWTYSLQDETGNCNRIECLRIRLAYFFFLIQRNLDFCKCKNKIYIRE